MKIYQFIERYFWLFLLAGLLLGLWYPVFNDILMSLLKPVLMIMLLFVFLKTDLIHILEKIRDIRLMTYTLIMYMLIIPILFFLSVNLFNPGFAAGVLLLTAMPAGVSSPTLTDIVKGNTTLSMSIVIITSLAAPFTVPLLFGLVKLNNISINPFAVFKDLAIIVFVPMIISQIIKKYFPLSIIKSQHLFTSFNVILLLFIVYAVIGSQRELIMGDPAGIIRKLVFLYLIFILLHIIGYMMGYKQSKENRVAFIIGAAYMNNGMAIVLAATHFDTSVLILMVLSEIPWNTLLEPFRRIIAVIEKNPVTHSQDKYTR
jgi:predicted Na+-dependent transporter